MIYSLNDILSINKKYVTQNNLQKETLIQLKSIECIINAKGYKLSPNFIYKSKFNNDRTQIEKEISQLKSNLNKLSEKNYDILMKKIKQQLKDLEMEFNLEDKQDCANTVFKIASSNLFYAKIYASMFYELYNTFEFMKPPLINSLNMVIDTYKSISSIDNVKDYNIFCDILKDNEKRISLLTFIIYLMRKDLVSQEKIIEIALFLKNEIELDKNKDDIEQYSHNLLIIIQLAHNYINENNKYKSLEEHINCYRNKKPGGNLTWKTIFKYYDMNDYITGKRMYEE